MKVVVTGISGHVGKAVSAELLDNGHEVVGIDVAALGPELRKRDVRMVYADIADGLAVLSATQGCDAIIHCAAYASPWGRTSQEMLRINVIGTQNMLEAAMAHDIGRVVVTSSVGALGLSFPKHPVLPDYFPIDTAHPRRPQDIYGLTKLMNEESCEAATRLSGLTTVVIRPPFVADLEKMIDRSWMRRRLQHAPEKPEPSFWSYVDVHDLAVAYRSAIERDLTGYNIFFVMADDVLANEDAPGLIRRFHPDRIEDIDKLTGKSFYDLIPTEKGLGFTAKLLWRDMVKSLDEVTV